MDSKHKGRKQDIDTVFSGDNYDVKEELTKEHYFDIINADKSDCWYFSPIRIVLIYTLRFNGFEEIRKMYYINKKSAAISNLLFTDQWKQLPSLKHLQNHYKNQWNYFDEDTELIRFLSVNFGGFKKIYKGSLREPIAGHYRTVKYRPSKSVLALESYLITVLSANDIRDQQHQNQKRYCDRYTPKPEGQSEEKEEKELKEEN